MPLLNSHLVQRSRARNVTATQIAVEWPSAGDPSATGVAKKVVWCAVPCKACHFGRYLQRSAPGKRSIGPVTIGTLDIDYAAAFPGESSRANIVLVTAVATEHFDNFISDTRSRTC